MKLVMIVVGDKLSILFVLNVTYRLLQSEKIFSASLTKEQERNCGSHLQCLQNETFTLDNVYAIVYSTGFVIVKSSLQRHLSILNYTVE